MHQGPKSSGTGLGSDPIRTGHSLPHVLEATPENIHASNLGAAYANWIKGIDKKSTAWQDRLSEQPDSSCKDCSLVA